jgi:hypothetical protein
MLGRGLLAKIGFHATGADTPLPAATVNQFDSEWGSKIRRARPRTKPEPKFSGETDVPPPPAADSRKPQRHVMRIAHSKITAGRSAAGGAEKRLLDDPGPVHAIDAAGTNEGDPWRGQVVPGGVHFYGGGMNNGSRAACGRAHMRAVLGDEFVPAEDPLRSGQCPRCAALVADGKGFRNPPDPFGYRSPICDKYLRIRVDGLVAVKDCLLRDLHMGAHRALDGSEWSVGVDDYVPSSGEVGRTITKAS